MADKTWGSDSPGPYLSFSTLGPRALHHGDPGGLKAICVFVREEPTVGDRK
jgi:hypothetical protein